MQCGTYATTTPFERLVGVSSSEQRLLRPQACACAPIASTATCTSATQHAHLLQLQPGQLEMVWLQWAARMLAVRLDLLCCALSMHCS